MDHNAKAVDPVLPAGAISLQDAFPGWRIWRSDRGRWWATRRTRFTDAEEYAGCSRTVDADDVDGLREAIEEQEARRRKVAEDQP